MKVLHLSKKYHLNFTITYCGIWDLGGYPPKHTRHANKATCLTCLRAYGDDEILKKERNRRIVAEILDK